MDLPAEALGELGLGSNPTSSATPVTMAMLDALATGEVARQVLTFT